MQISVGIGSTGRVLGVKNFSRVNKGTRGSRLQSIPVKTNPVTIFVD